MLSEQELVMLLTKCQPPATRLVAQQYSYEWNAQDRELLGIFEQVTKGTDQQLSDEQLAAILARADLTEESMLWLVCLSALTDVMRQRVGRSLPTPDHPYRPFAEALQQLEQSIQSNVMMGILDYRDDAELVHLPALGRKSPLLLIQALRQWQNFNDHLYGSSTSEISASERTRGEPKRRFHRQPDALPSRATHFPWIYVQRMQGSYPGGAKEQGGHWRICVSRSDVDALWQRIAEAVRQGALGRLARVSTLSGSSQFQNQEHVILVYTYGAQDEADIKRIRTGLRELGVDWPIAYKAHGSRPEQIPLLHNHDPFTLYFE
jgi:hypothetical protein